MTDASDAVGDDVNELPVSFSDMSILTGLHYCITTMYTTFLSFCFFFCLSASFFL